MLNRGVLATSMPAGNAEHWDPSYTTTHRDNNVNVDKINHIFIVLVLPTKSVFKH